MPRLHPELPKQKTKGPAPKCVCGTCYTCKGRLRQRRFLERQRELRLQAIQPTDSLSFESE